MVTVSLSTIVTSLFAGHASAFKLLAAALAVCTTPRILAPVPVPETVALFGTVAVCVNVPGVLAVAEAVLATPWHWLI